MSSHNGSDEHVHDCIVVGAGPAGSAAALQMARDGLDVILLERGTRPGEKNVMSGVLVTKKLRDLIPDFAERAPLQRRITGGYEAYILGESQILRLPSLRSYDPSRLRHPPYTVFRSQFDAWFAREAENAGAELFTETLVEDLLWENEQMTLNCEGCLDCGSCRVVCSHEALQWHYPRGGYGVRFRWG